MRVRKERWQWEQKNDCGNIIELEWESRGTRKRKKKRKKKGQNKQKKEQRKNGARLQPAAKEGEGNTWSWLESLDRGKATDIHRKKWWLAETGVASVKRGAEKCFEGSSERVTQTLVCFSGNRSKITRMIQKKPMGNSRKGWGNSQDFGPHSVGDHDCSSLLVRQLDDFTFAASQHDIPPPWDCTTVGRYWQLY